MNLDRNSMMGPPPRFFVFGPERSGTTLLAFLLTGQPDVFCINDSFVFRSFVNSVYWSSTEARRRVVDVLPLIPEAASGLFRDGPAQGWSRREVMYRAQVRRLLAEYPARHRLTSVETVRYLDILTRKYEAGSTFLREYGQAIQAPNLALPAEGELSLVDTFTWILNRLKSQFDGDPIDASIIGEKTPMHTVYWRWILESLYPDSCGVVVVRHPVTNISSILRRAPSLRAAKARYRRVTRAVLDLSQHPRVMVVKYEDLLESPKPTMQRIVELVGGKDFDPSLPIVPYVKDAYTGDRLDPSRNPRPEDLFDRRERLRIRRQFSRLYSAFQYD